MSEKNSSYVISKKRTIALIAEILGSVLPFSQSDTVRAEYPRVLPSSACDNPLPFRKYLIVSPTLLFVIQIILAENPLKYLTWRKIRYKM